MDLKAKEAKLKADIKLAKEKLASFQEKRKVEIGKLAFKFGLETWSDERLNHAFETLAKEQLGA